MPDDNQPEDNRSVLGNISVNEFLSEYWQKKPLLIRRAIPGYQSPIMPDELAGLACHENVESRIVLEKDRLAPWSVLHGPFYESDFKTLPETHWTLLVQECNTHVPELALLLDRFNFIPNWRVDDIMVSYAVKDGSVGPHMDQYDVFLLQARGLRRWQINTSIDKNADFLQDTELRILQNFESEEEWVLEPGDMLYLPPGVAHYGVALDECMTISVGFRAPDYYSLMAAFIDDRYASISDSFAIPRYQDPDLTPQKSCGEISEQSLQKIVEIIQSSCNDSQIIKQWFGRYITEPKNAIEPELPETEYTIDSLRDECDFQREIYRLEEARFAYLKNDSNTTLLFVNGEEFKLTNDLTILAPVICDHRRIPVTDLQELLNVPGLLEILVSLFNKGYLYFNES
ncbi:JmjC domain-containing protein [Kaarinaea lacus]